MEAWVIRAPSPGAACQGRSKMDSVAPVENGPLYSGGESLCRGLRVAAGEAVGALIGVVGAGFGLV